MKTIEPVPPLSSESNAVLESLLTGKPIDPEIVKQIHAKAKKIRERVLREHGLVDVAVPAMRNFRGELPDV